MFHVEQPRDLKPPDVPRGTIVSQPQEKMFHVEHPPVVHSPVLHWRHQLTAFK